MKHDTILLVEDNPDDVALMLRAFRRTNLANEIVLASDGEAALDHLFGAGRFGAAEGPVPVLILLDLKLPKVDGLEVLRRIRGHERTRLLPVVILTSSDEDTDLIRGYELGANGYVRKPVDFQEFAEAVVTLGLYWLVLNQSPPRLGAE